ncbi:MAG: hypothetical protein JXL20_03650 [Deltaproteobacteria bacterium]|nr:hypothetical protein [Deltaproteobacteria bacterium]
MAVPDISMGKAETRVQAVIGSGRSAPALMCDVPDAVQLRECCEAISAVRVPPGLRINGGGGNDSRGSTSF